LFETINIKFTDPKPMFAHNYPAV